MKFFSVFYKDFLQSCSEITVVNYGSMVDSTVTESLRCWKAGNHDPVSEGWIKKRVRCDLTVASCQSDQYGCPIPHHCCSGALPAAAGSGSVWCVSESAGLWRRARVGVLRMSASTFQHERGDADQSGPPWHHLWKSTWEVLHAGQWHTWVDTYIHRRQFTLTYVNTKMTSKAAASTPDEHQTDTLKYTTEPLLWLWLFFWEKRSL